MSRSTATPSLSSKQKSQSQSLRAAPASTSTSQQQKDMFNILTQKYLDNVLNRDDGISELEVKFGTKNIKQITKNDFDNVFKKLISSGFRVSMSQEYSLKIQS